MRQVSQEFSFEDAGRTFTCHVDTSGPRAEDAWWWFAVSTERNQRHAPFRAAVSDTHEGIQQRVVAYYDDLLARRAAPRQVRGHWRQPARPAPGVQPQA